MNPVLCLFLWESRYNFALLWSKSATAVDDADVCHCWSTLSSIVSSLHFFHQNFKQLYDSSDSLSEALLQSITVVNGSAICHYWSNLGYIVLSPHRLHSDDEWLFNSSDKSFLFYEYYIFQNFTYACNAH